MITIKIGLWQELEKEKIEAGIDVKEKSEIDRRRDPIKWGGGEAILKIVRHFGSRSDRDYI